MMKNKYKIIGLLPAVVLLSACDDDKWEAGPEVEANMGVYFSSQSAYSYEIEPDDSHLLELKLARINDSVAMSVPLTVVSCPEGVTVPQSVSFEAGSRTASFFVDVTNMAEKSSGAVEIKLDQAYTNVYAAGTSSIRLDVLMTGGWIPVCDELNVRYEDLSFNSVMPKQTTQLLQLDGTYKFKIVDFMYSGLDLYFNVADISEHQTSGSSEIVPYKNTISFTEVFPDEEDEYNMWVFYDTDKQEVPVWTPPGSDLAVATTEFYSGKTYQQISFSKGTGKFRGTVDYEDDSWSYLYIDFTFKPNFDPFADWSPEE